MLFYLEIMHFPLRGYEICKRFLEKLFLLGGNEIPYSFLIKLFILHGHEAY